MSYVAILFCIEKQNLFFQINKANEYVRSVITER